MPTPATTPSRRPPSRSLGGWGVWFTVAIAVIATLSGLLASLFAVSRLYAMLRDMRQAPALPGQMHHKPLLITAGAGHSDRDRVRPDQIASLGAMLYLTMDIAIHWGMLRHLRGEVGARIWVPTVAIVLDLLVLAPFVVMKFRTDLLTLGITAAVVVATVTAQWFAVRQRTATSVDR